MLRPGQPRPARDFNPRLEWPKTFPFAALRCPRINGPPNGSFPINLTALLSTVCHEPAAWEGPRGALPAWFVCLCSLVRANHTPKTASAAPNPIFPASRGLLIPKNLDGQKTRRSPRRQNRGSDGNSQSCCRDPNSVERARVKWNIRDRVDLRIERNQMIVPRHKSEGETNEKPDHRPSRADGDTLP